MEYGGKQAHMTHSSTFPHKHIYIHKHLNMLIYTKICPQTYTTGHAKFHSPQTKSRFQNKNEHVNFGKKIN